MFETSMSLVMKQTASSCERERTPSLKPTFRRDVSLLLVAPTTFEDARLASMRWSRSRKGESRSSRFLVIESTPSGRSRGDVILSSFLMIGDSEACEWSGRAFVYPLSASIESPVGVGHFLRLGPCRSLTR